MAQVFRVSALKAALLIGSSMMMPAIAAAQDGDVADSGEAAAEGDEIIVSGFRESLDAALDIKRSSVNAVDAILAEDIADFPDLNLAESIQRIPGVSIDRDNGEGRSITVRGLNPDFTRVQINGMETLATTGSTDASGGTNRGRGFDFNTFASELFNSIKVTKSPTPQTEEGSLGAVVSLQTGRPFDYNGLALAASLQGQYNNVADQINPRMAGLVSWSNPNETVGVLVSASYSQRDIVEEGFSSVRFAGNLPPTGTNAQSFSNRNAFQNEADFPDAATAFFPRIPRYGVLTSDQERLGITAALQVRPSDTTLVSLDLLYSRFKGSRREQFLEAISFSRNNAAGIRDTEIVALEVDPTTRNIISGTFNDVDVRIEDRIDDLDTKFKQATLEIEQEIGSSITARLMGGISESDFRVGRQTTIIADNLNVDGYSIDFSADPNLPLIDYGFDVTDPSNFTVNEVRDRPQGTLNNFRTLKLDLDWEVDANISFQVGGSWKNFEYETDEARRDRVLPAASQFVLTDANSVIATLSDSLNAPSGLDTVFITPDADAIAQQIGLYTNAFPLVPNNGSLNQVEENDYALYAQVTGTFDLGGMELRSVAGLRYIRTDTSSTGILNISGGSPTPTTVDNSYEDWLPSIAVTLEPANDLIVRGSFAKQMARPTLGSLTPGGNFSAFSETLSFGNPLLLPFRADSFDLGVEWYFAPEALVSVGLFYKDIATFVTRETSTVPFRDLGLPDSLLVGSPSSPDNDYTVTRNINGEGGSLKGVEFQFQTPFSFLPGALSDFGVIANLTLIDSEVNYGTTAAPLLDQLRGLSKTAFNTTLYYEDSKFSARVSGAYRSDFLTRVPGQNGNDIEGTNSSFNLDASMSYAITDQIRVTLEGINLLDTFRNQFVDSVGDRPVTYTHTGRSVLVGVRFKL